MLLGSRIKVFTLQSQQQHRSDQCGFEIAAAWRVSLGIHMVRRADYKGKSSASMDNRIRLPFDSMSTVGVMYAAAWLL